MKALNSRCAVVAAALVGLGFGSIALAQGTSSSSSSSSSAHWHHAHWHGARGYMFVGTLLRATRQLNLTADQKQSIKTLLSQARSQLRSSSGAPDMTVTGNPGDANFASAVQALQSRASSRIEQESELASSIYNVLTPEQKQQLPTVLASIKAKAAQRRAAWQAQHSAGTTSSSN
jgi:Spy/CpxP family protein refolding chaperone